MADELQALLDKINDEGIRKAQLKQEDILAKAREEAAAIVKAAQEQAAALTDNARNEAALLQQKGQEALRQAARDIMLGLKQTLQDRVRQAVISLLKETLEGDKLASVIAEVVTQYVARNGDVDDLTLLVGQNQLETLEGAVKTRLADDLKARCNLAPAQNLNAGFKLAFAGNDVMYDFSDQALADAVAAYVGPKVAAALNA